ncbi:RluA family pseudouridine synthase [Haloimpatiens lingqiaonensis]|uniref:RluA family pseudouridine synthase n=1 Tax=Haloimpatiens lingqiaonensis TaxID=1380675 RepID=UPI0010FE1F92|nr:RluA family pseudouridine synthase [Haloimpatiens lingqiaonensis]
MDNIIKYIVKKGQEEVKLKEYLKFTLQLSSRFIRNSINDRRIKVNGKNARLNNKVAVGDVIEIKINKEEEQNIPPEKMDLHIVYEDEDVIVLNKAPGMVVHPTRSYPTGTLSNGLLYYFKEKGENCIVRLVSRLDMDTSGLILIAKNQFAHMALARDMKEETFQKEYLAIVHGNLKQKSGTIDKPIYRTDDDSIQRVIDVRGQESITHYTVLESYAGGDLVKLKLETGRTHQIRVHLSSLGHPLYGDILYGKEEKDYIVRQALHAFKLSFPHPRDGHIVQLECGMPEDMKELISKIENFNTEEVISEK